MKVILLAQRELEKHPERPDLAKHIVTYTVHLV